MALLHHTPNIEQVFVIVTLREVRDPVHGFIELEATEWSVVNSRAFQRLRGVQQLAMTHLVYPGARHSRFEHCIGACYIAGRIADRVNLVGGVSVAPDRVRLAALTHDIGHGPFSHVSEEVFEELTGRDNIHESLSSAIVMNDPQVSSSLGEEVSTWISDLLLYQGSAVRRTVERDIVSGPADIDKLDYLLRDSHYCGVNYGKYDLSKIVESAHGFQEQGGDSYLAFNEDGIYALEEMLLARYHMHRQVYGHKTRIGIDRMLVRAMLSGVEEGLLDRNIFAPPTDLNEAFVQEYLKWDDAVVIQTLTKAPAESVAGQIMRALVERRLCKRKVHLELSDLQRRFEKSSAGWIARADKSVLREHRPLAEAEIATAANVPPHWVILHWEDRKSQVSLPGDDRISAKDILIVSPDSPPDQFHDRSEVFTKEAMPSEPSISLYVGSPENSTSGSYDETAVTDALYSSLDRIGQAARSL